MAQFAWLSAGPIPAAYDLRQRAWELVEEPVPGLAVPRLQICLFLPAKLQPRIERAAIVLVGIDDPVARAHFLALGFGEVLPRDVVLDELAARVRRVAAALVAVPRRRMLGRLTLDLLTRDGYVEGGRLALHPREFALLWRLAETPGEAVAPEALLGDVWRLNFRPETNSLAVHVCRLRAKLAVAGLPQIIRTAPDGAYALVSPHGPAAPPLHPGSTAISLAPDNPALDEYVRLIKSVTSGIPAAALGEEV
ncbi:MAG: winged helix-turn-helix domain-containing protein [Pseudomonadota bacterium]